MDVARSGGLVCGVVPADAVLARDVTRSDLEAVAAACHRWPRIASARLASARIAMEFADGRLESPLESVGRVRFHQHGLVAPDLQVGLRDQDGDVGRVDHYWSATRAVGEADGAVKYSAPGPPYAESEMTLKSEGRVCRW